MRTWSVQGYELRPGRHRLVIRVEVARGPRGLIAAHPYTRRLIRAVMRVH